MKTVVSVSGGLGSAEALKRVVEMRGKENVVALFADVKGSGQSHFWTLPSLRFVDELLHERFGGESRDLYQFLWQLSYHFDTPIERLEDGRSTWAVWAKSRMFRLFSGGVFVHACSEQLKRQMIAAYIQSHCKPGEYEIALGMGWQEEHRITASERYWRDKLGWDVRVYSPLLDKPLADNCVTEAWLKEAGIVLPAAYGENFDHNNCAGGCIAAGQAHFANLYNTRRDIYLYWAYMEARLQRYWGKFVTILKDERNGFTKPMSLYAFIARIEAGDYPRQDWGACGCFVGQPTLFELPAIKVAS